MLETSPSVYTFTKHVTSLPLSESVKMHKACTSCLLFDKTVGYWHLSEVFEQQLSASLTPNPTSLIVHHTLPCPHVSLIVHHTAPLHISQIVHHTAPCVFLNSQPHCFTHLLGLRCDFCFAATIYLSLKLI